MVEYSQPPFSYERFYKRFSTPFRRADSYQEMLSGLVREDRPAADFACYALWEGARIREDEILKTISSKFQILGDFIIHWSDEHYNANIARLYERPDRKKEFTRYSRKIGRPPFRFVIVRDDHPEYAWARSVSGKIEPTNKNIVATKYELRRLFDRDFLVHSSNNFEEFLFHSALVIGAEKTKALISGKSVPLGGEYGDLTGANGWKSWDEFFSTMSLCSEFLVLRNFEDLPGNYQEQDIDILCSNFQRFASAANILQRSERSYKGRFKVAGKTVAADIRFVGDGYYPQRWQMNMLANRVYDGCLFIPAPDDLFFSLLFHAKVHKPEVKASYFDKLLDLSRLIKADWFSREIIESDGLASDIIGGYMRSCQYYLESPVDKNVYINKKIAEKLPKIQQHKGLRYFDPAARLLRKWRKSLLRERT